MRSVNALNGLLLISSTDHADFITDCNMCQCPQRASTYFFNKPYNTGGKHNEVSMPSTGFYLFLHYSRRMSNLNKKKCQCPQRASTYFFIHQSQIEEIIECVNALNGLLLISSQYHTVNIQDGDMCQCPQRASTYFFSKDVKQSEIE